MNLIDRACGSKCSEIMASQQIRKELLVRQLCSSTKHSQHGGVELKVVASDATKHRK